MAFVMELLDRVKNGFFQLIEALSGSVFACVFISSISALATACLIRFLVGALFEMHRSRTGIKKIKKNYGFWQKLLMQPAWKECLHAKTFCRFLIVCHHARIILWIFILLLALISNWVPDLLRISGYSIVVLFLLLDIPLWVMDLFLDKYPLRRMKHEYRFRKFHNSKDHNSLF